MNADAFISRLRSRGYHTLGSGLYSVVLAKGDSDRVIKVCHRMDDWPAYAMWSSKAGFGGTLAPKVYSLKVYGNWYVAVMERLVDTVQNANSADVRRKWQTLSRAMSGFENLEGNLDVSQEKFVKEFRAANLGRTDVHDLNFMTRSDGTLVATDPIGSNTMDWMVSSARRQRARDLIAA